MAEDKDKQGDGDSREKLLRALEHPERRDLLQLLHDSSEPMTTEQLAKANCGTTAQTRYQLRVLAEHRAVRFLDSSPQQEGSTKWASMVEDDEDVTKRLEGGDKAA